MTTYIADHGYLDGIVRGFATQLLTAAEYSNLTQCESVDDMKVHLMSTGYESVFRDVPSPLTPQSVADACTAKMVEEFKYLRSNAYEPLDKFLDYITFDILCDFLLFHSSFIDMVI